MIADGMVSHVSMSECHAVTNAIATRYARSSRTAKKAILHELCAVTGWRRDHARKPLPGAGTEGSRNRGLRPPPYGDQAMEALRFC